MTYQPQGSEPDERTMRARFQRQINTSRCGTDGSELRQMIFNTLSGTLPPEARADPEWVIVQVRCRIGIEGEEPSGTIVRQAFECGDITVARYHLGQAHVASIRMGISVALDAGDVTHLHHASCGCGMHLGKSDDAFDPAAVPGLAELRAAVASGAITGDTEASPWAA